MSTITFIQSSGEQSAESQPDETVFDTAKRTGAGIHGVCGGHGSCGLCRVEVIAGKEHLNPATGVEKDHVGSAGIVAGFRLGCQIVPTGDVKVKI